MRRSTTVMLSIRRRADRLRQERHGRRSDELLVVKVRPNGCPDW